MLLKRMMTPMLLDEGSVRIRFKANHLDTDQGLVSKDASGFGTGGHFGLWLGADQKIHARVGSTSENYELVSTTNVQVDQWTDVMLTFGSRGLELYLNGNLEATNSHLGGLGTSSGGLGNFEPLVLGADSWMSADFSASPLEAFFDGMMDLVELHNKQLTA